MPQKIHWLIKIDELGRLIIITHILSKIQIRPLKMLKTIPLPQETMQCTNLTKFFRKTDRFYLKKKTKIRVSKKFKTISLSLEILLCNINKPKGDSLAPEAEKTEKIKNFQKT